MRGFVSSPPGSGANGPANIRVQYVTVRFGAIAARPENLCRNAALLWRKPITSLPMGKRWPGAKLLENSRRCFAYMIQLASQQVLRLGAKNKIVNYLFSREDR